LTLLPCLAIAQRDFETRYFTISATSLPEVPEIESSFSLDKAPTLFSELKTFRMNTKNYQVPVDMMTALANRESYIEKEWEVNKKVKKDRALEFSVRVYNDEYYNNGINRNSSLRVHNNVYNQLNSRYYYSPLDLYSIQK